MVENPSHISRADGMCKASKSGGGGGGTKKTSNSLDDTGEMIKCSGKYCRSCSASLIADCVAICCCPCAVINMLTLAFVKVPYSMGRRCLVLLKKKTRNSGKIREIDGVKEGRAVQGNAGEEEEEEEVETNGVEEGERVCARVEAERVWLELYQVGHLGFGRVSFTGIQEKGN